MRAKVKDALAGLEEARAREGQGPLRPSPSRPPQPPPPRPTPKAACRLSAEAGRRQEAGSRASSCPRTREPCGAWSPASSSSSILVLLLVTGALGGGDGGSGSSDSTTAESSGGGQGESSNAANSLRPTQAVLKPVDGSDASGRRCSAGQPAGRAPGRRRRAWSRRPRASPTPSPSSAPRPSGCR